MKTNPATCQSEGRRSKRGSAYLVALGVVSILVISGIMLSRHTVQSRWQTLFMSNAKRAEECAESAANLTFRIIRENMNDYSSFWELLKDPSELLQSWFLMFRLPTPVAGAYIDPVAFDGAKSNGVDVQLDLFSNAIFRPIYQNGKVYVYDTATPDPNSPLAPLHDMFSALGGRVRVVTTSKISRAFAILATNPNFKVAGIELPTEGLTGFLVKLLDRTDTSKIQFDFNLLDFIPEVQLLKAPDLTGLTITVQGVPVPIGYLLQPLIIDPLFEKLGDSQGLDTKTIATKLFGDTLNVSFNMDELKENIREKVLDLLPDFINAFVGNISFQVTVEKQGLLQVKSEVEYYPYYPQEGPSINRTLVMEREFRVADIQPIAPDHTFFVANSALLYENADIENSDNWEGDDQIDWNKGAGALVIHNLPPLSTLIDTLSSFSSLDLKQLSRSVMLPGLVRVNGTKEMLINLGMFDRFPPTLRFIEVAALLLPHENENMDCHSHHDGNKKQHTVVPGLKSVRYNFWDKGKPFDWGYFGTAKPGGGGAFWFPIPPLYARTLLFGDFHLGFPFSLRAEGYLKKVYSHIKLLLVKIYIPPIPIIGFLGLEIPIPWLWYSNHKEPYGFCKYPGYESEEEGRTLWDPNDHGNLPPNLYSPSQYLKKASYFYPTSMDFQRDIDNRSVIHNDKKVLVIDGVTFVNDNLWLPQGDLYVMGRGMIVAAGNIHLGGNIKRIEYDRDGNNTIFSLIARSGAIINSYRDLEIHACLFADRGLHNTMGTRLKIRGNLVVNRFERDRCQGIVDVYYESKHTRSSLISLLRPVAKFDPTRYHVTLSQKIHKFEFVRDR